MNNLFSRWKDGLSRTSKAAFGQIASILGTSEITADTWDDLEALLLQADLGIETTASVLDSLKRTARTEGLTRANELLAYPSAGTARTPHHTACFNFES